MSELIFITSGKGGTGKTTVAAALACGLAESGLRTLAVDCDFGLGNLDIALGTAERVLFNLGDLLSGNVSEEQAVLGVEGFEGLGMIPAAGEGFRSACGQRLRAVLAQLKKNWDAVVVDGPAGLGEVTGVCAGVAERALIVTNPETAGLRDSAAAARLLRACGVPDVRLVLNRLEKSRMRRGGSRSVDEAIDSLEVRLAGLVREDRAAADAFTAERPLLSLETAAGEDIRDIVRRLRGESPDIRKYRAYIR